MPEDFRPGDVVRIHPPDGTHGIGKLYTPECDTEDGDTWWLVENVGEADGHPKFLESDMHHIRPEDVNFGLS